MLYLYGAAIFLSACLLFIMELLYAKMILPFLGGSPSVWITCNVFFQFALLVGYLYAHFIVNKLKANKQVMLHIILLMIPIALLPVAIPQSWQRPSEHNPVLWVLSIMIVTVGFPFTILSTSSPLLQQWFAYTRHKYRNDPYFLYAASNIGSFTGLIGYLLLIEPNLSIAKQNIYWKYGYIFLAVMIALCGAAILFTKRDDASAAEYSDDSSSAIISDKPITLKRKLYWIILAFIPSSLMLGLTTHITVDIASVPLLWVIPLGLYLLSYVIAFSKHIYIPQRILIKLLPILVIIQTVVFIGLPFKMVSIFIVPMLTFFVAAIVCHRELVLDRPSANHLTLFYLLMSVGGMLGGIFNALLAPVIFNSIAEYPIVLVLACVVCIYAGIYRYDKNNIDKVKIVYEDSIFIIGISAAAFLVLYIIRTLRFSFDSYESMLLLAIVGVLIYITSKYPMRFGIILGLVLFILNTDPMKSENVLYKNRSFFGVIKVEKLPISNLNKLVHGTTLHGAQFMDPQLRNLPLTYYFRSGPIGDLFNTFSGVNEKENIAVVGLGTGCISSYVNVNQNMTFYEIDSSVRDMAMNPKYFTYLTDAKSRGANVDVVIGDARLKIAEAPNAFYDMIVLDAFSSDSIPVHLCTQQALQLYLSKLKPDGILVYHLSNRYLDLLPVIGNMLIAASLESYVFIDDNISEDESRMWKTRSSWLVSARKQSDFQGLTDNESWIPVLYNKDKQIWTDDFSNILSILKK